MEENGFAGFRVSRRHPSPRGNQETGGKDLTSRNKHPAVWRFQNKSPQVNPLPHTTHNTFGFPDKFFRRKTASTPSETNIHSKRTWEVCSGTGNVLQKTHQNFGSGKRMPSCPSFSEGCHRPFARDFKLSSNPWLGQKKSPYLKS